ncbi:hypothetical protein [Micromonospora sp. KC606]|uniref:hypothetical protein n=1 Tax=Micromonospora sp. KC606 TaxID=2530379 RepID=UPI001FB84470|nr:hypothetical protein [Micromonospora sp. KC606]
MLQQPGVRADDVAVPVDAGPGEEPFPLLREESAHAPVQPVDLRAPHAGDRGDDDLRDPVRIRRLVDEAVAALRRRPMRQRITDVAPDLAPPEAEKG